MDDAYCIDDTAGLILTEEPAKFIYNRRYNSSGALQIFLFKYIFLFYSHYVLFYKNISNKDFHVKMSNT